jgi:regulator of sigma E protease
MPYKNEEGKERIGVYLGTSAEIYYQKPLQKVTSGFLHTYNVLSYSVNGFGHLIGVSVQERSAEPLSETVSGPIGIYSLVDTILDYSKGKAFLNLIDLMALISVSLAFLNILPLPALDGGRILFILIEGIRGKKVNPELEAKVHKVGLLAFVTLLILVSVRDVGRFF